MHARRPRVPPRTLHRACGVFGECGPPNRSGPRPTLQPQFPDRTLACALRTCTTTSEDDSSSSVMILTVTCRAEPTASSLTRRFGLPSLIQPTLTRPLRFFFAGSPSSLSDSRVSLWDSLSLTLSLSRVRAHPVGALGIVEVVLAGDGRNERRQVPDVAQPVARPEGRLLKDGQHERERAESDERAKGEEGGNGPRDCLGSLT